MSQPDIATLIARLRNETVLDAGDGPFVELWEADFNALLDTLTNPTPIEMLLFCPKCGLKHVDEPDERTPDWTNPPHRSHLCHDCGTIWRPADVATTGVAAIGTTGKADTIDLNEVESLTNSTGLIDGQPEHPLAKMVRLDEEMGLYDTDERVPLAPGIEDRAKAATPRRSGTLDEVCEAAYKAYLGKEREDFGDRCAFESGWEAALASRLIGQAGWEDMAFTNEDWFYLWRWVERGLFDSHTSHEDALEILAYSPAAPWMRGRWDVDHKPYAKQLYKRFPKARALQPPGDR